jgi:hypothetical protein
VDVGQKGGGGLGQAGPPQLTVLMSAWLASSAQTGYVSPVGPVGVEGHGVGGKPIVGTPPEYGGALSVGAVVSCGGAVPPKSVQCVQTLRIAIDAQSFAPIAVLPLRLRSPQVV